MKPSPLAAIQSSITSLCFVILFCFSTFFFFKIKYPSDKEEISKSNYRRALSRIFDYKIGKFQRFIGNFRNNRLVFEFKRIVNRAEVLIKQ